MNSKSLYPILLLASVSLFTQCMNDVPLDPAISMYHDKVLHAKVEDYWAGNTSTDTFRLDVDKDGIDDAEIVVYQRYSTSSYHWTTYSMISPMNGYEVSYNTIGYTTWFSPYQDTTFVYHKEKIPRSYDQGEYITLNDSFTTEPLIMGIELYSPRIPRPMIRETKYGLPTGDFYQYVALHKEGLFHKMAWIELKFLGYSKVVINRSRWTRSEQMIIN